MARRSLSGTLSLELPLLSDKENHNEEGFGSGKKHKLQTVPGRFSHVPCTEGLSWKDDFFERYENVIAVFDNDIETLHDFHGRTLPIRRNSLIVFLIFNQILLTAYFVGYRCVAWGTAFVALSLNSLLIWILYFKLILPSIMEMVKGRHIAFTTERFIVLQELTELDFLTRAFLKLLSKLLFGNIYCNGIVIYVKCRYDEVESCVKKTGLVPGLYRESTYVHIKIKGWWLPLSLGFLEYPDAFVELLNHLKQNLPLVVH